MKLPIIIFLVAVLVIPLFSYMIADHVKFLQKIFCKIGWHSHQYDIVEIYSDDPYGTATKHQCKWCKKTGLVDSQGNLF